MPIIKQKMIRGVASYYQYWRGNLVVEYNPIYELFYLTNDDESDITVSVVKSNSNAPIISLEVSNDGHTWTTLGDTSTTALDITIPVGGRKYIRSISNNAWGESGGYYNRFISTGLFGAHGSIMSLLGYDDLKGYDCYGMFHSCTGLTTAPELPAITLAGECYYNMFYGCTSMAVAPELPATTLAIECYRSMFQNCSAITTAPVLPATTLVDSCYRAMFQNCSSLTQAPVLSVTTMADNCYRWMFNGCTSLVNAPALPATTLAPYCYHTMFGGCTSLTTAPELPATTLVNYCYQAMFQNCSNLSSVTCNATNKSATACTTNWLSGVAASGTFYKNPTAGWSTGTSGVPNGWTIVDIP